MSKSVLVTGANSGIGLVTALELAGAGYDVVGSVRSAAKAEVVQRASAERGVTVRTVRARRRRRDQLPGRHRAGRAR